MVTIKDVAKEANVSISTVSYVLSGKKKVTDNTKERVLKAVAELGYKPSGIAQSLKTQKTNFIGVFLEEFRGPVFNEIIHGISQEAKRYGYEILVTEYTKGSTEISRLFSQRIADGAIVLASNVSDEIITQYASEKFPIVTMDRDIKHEAISSIVIDNQQVCQELIQGLLEKGYQNFYFLNGPQGTYDSDMRRLGFISTLHLQNNPILQYREEYGNFTEENGYTVAKKLIKANELPEVICCANDEMALGVINALKEHGISIPQEVAVTGFDDIRIAEYVTPTLTTIKRPSFDLGATAAKILIDGIEKKIMGKRMILSTEVVWRDSTKM
ncbi:MAG: LacI family DNA-binding transcriptional regulator [Turicibacter sp.]